MFSQAHFPSEPLNPEELDSYLSKGWFRMGQSIFTCTYLGLNEEVYRTFWLRIVLDGFSESKTFKKLSKLNSKFRIRIQEASITPEKEELFKAYKKGITFEPSESIEQLLNREAGVNIFNTLEINIYDKDKLIAVGYFDVGKDSAAGISSFYHPDYKKYSLGKYLIYQKLLYCKNQQIKYYYLGYFAPGCKAFDYKLDIAKNSLEYLDTGSYKWYTIDTWDPVTGSIEETRQKLKALQQQLTKVNIENHLFRYKYFQANIHPEFQGCELFDSLLFVYCFKIDPNLINPIVVYDFRDQEYHLLKVISVGRTEELADDTEEFSNHLLMIEKVIYSTSDEAELAEVIARATSVPPVSTPPIHF